MRQPVVHATGPGQNAAVSLLDQIGDTPLVRLERCVPTNGAEIWLKLEYQNPTGSMKDRMAFAMIEGAEADGLIGPGTTIVEYSGGSTGPALALICAVKGYRCRIVISDSHTEERIQLMRALGAEVEIVPSVEGRPPRVSAEDIRRMAERSAELAALPDHYATLQFTNPYIVPALRDGLGREIWEQTAGRVTAFVQGVGTGGSIMGVARALKPRGVHILALEPASSAAISGGPQGSFAIQGWSGMVPPRWDPAWVDDVGQILDHEAIEMTRRLSRDEGIFAGISTGANVVGAIRAAERLGPDAVVVTLAVDTGFKYMSVAPYGQPTYATGLVGRDEELAAVESFLAAASVGPQRLVLEGEPGTGVTTLWQAAVRGARERNYTVLACRPSDGPVRRSFGSLRDLLGSLPRGAFDSLPPPQRRAIDIALLLREPSEPPPEPRAIGLAVLGVLRQLASLRPVVVAIDDAHRLDAASAAAVTFAASRIEADLISVVLARSPEESALVDIDGFVRLPVEPLSLGALHRLIQDRLEAVFPRPEIVRIHRISGGNPFIALELAAARSQRTQTDEPISPSRATELLRERLAVLPGDVRDSLVELATLPDRGEDSLDRERIGREAAGLVEMDGDRLRFTHPLVASAAYELAPPARLRAAHARAAELVEDPEERARHLALATDERAGQTSAALEQAARHVAKLGATVAAAELAELAVRATPIEDPTALVRRRLFAAETLIWAGEPNRPRAMLEDLVKDLGPRWERALARLLLATTRLDDLEAASALAARALVDAADDQALRSDINAFLALVWHVRADLPRSLAHARAARAAAETVGDARLLARVLALVALLETLASPTVEDGLLELALELEAETERPARVYSPRLVSGIRSLLAGRLDDARAALEADHAAAVASGDEAGRLPVLGYLAELELRTGRWDAASGYAHKGVELAEQVGPPHLLAHALAVQARVCAHRGSIDEAWTAASRGANVAAEAKAGVPAMENAAVLGFVELSRGRLQDADRHLRPLLHEVERVGFIDPAATPFVADAIEAMIESGETDLARRHIEQLEARIRDRPSPWARGVAHRSRGVWLAASGQLNGAEDTFKAALSEFEKSGEPFERGRTLLALGTALRRAKQKGAARDAIEASVTVFEQLGAPTWAERARSELARIAGRRRGSSGLTPTEQRVAELVAKGLSNKEVAAALHVTVKTVEGTLSRIYSKLGVRSRSGLAGQLAGKEVTRTGL